MVHRIHLISRVHIAGKIRKMERSNAMRASFGDQFCKYVPETGTRSATRLLYLVSLSFSRARIGRDKREYDPT